MAEYITKEALRAFPIRANHYDREHGNEHFINGIETVMEYAENLPAADVAPVVHGRWKQDYFFDEPVTRCSACGVRFAKGHKAERFPYCPNCAAKMDGVT